MGVQGLWKLVEPCGRMVPLEGLSNKVLAVDVSIWLHQAMNGMHNTQGAPVATAHLLVLFHRLCKLLFYKIKPVFVFDGGVPPLKRQTIANRRLKKSTARSEASRVRGKLLKNLLKHEALRHVLADQAATAALGLTSLTLPGPVEEEDLYKLPPVASQPSASNTSESNASDSEEDEEKPHMDIHSVDVDSPAFRALPAEVRHDILSDLKDTRKQNSWRHLDQMPQKSQDFSDFQMNRLLKRRAVQVSLEECGKEMGARDVSLQELEGMLGDGFSRGSVISGRVAQEDTTKFMLIQKPTETDPPPLTPQAIEKKGLIGASEGFDITEHLDEVMWSSESESEVTSSFDGGGSSMSSPKNLSQKSDIDGHLKPNQYPLSQLLASSRTVDEIAAVLGEGIDEANPEVNKRKVLSMQVDFDDVGSKNIVLLEKVKMEVSSQQNPVPMEVDLEDVGTTNIVSLKEEIQSVRDENEGDDRLLMKSTSSDKIVTREESQSSILGSKLELVQELTRGSKENDLANILDVLEDEEAECIPDQIIAKQSSDIEILTRSRASESVSLDRTRTPSPPVSDLEIANDKNLQAQSADQQTIVICEEHIGSEPTEETAQEGTQIRPTTTTNDQQMIDYLEDVVKIPPTGFSVTKVEEDTTVAKNKESEENTSQVQKKEMEDSASTDSEDDLVPVEDSPPKYPTSPERPETSETEDEEAKEQPEVAESGKMSDAELKGMQASLESERDQLMSEQGRQERMAQTVTDQMCADAQELLRLFGVPFLVAPMEAEAQCAALDQLGLTEGTITDDSDIWLFGGRVVYKNFFNQKKHVLEYRCDDIRQYFKLSREDMVRLALLVGSDYTPGLPGIGPVTALEVLAAFPSPQSPPTADQVVAGLRKFEEWVRSGFLVGPTRASLRNKVKNTSLIPGFPSKAVVEAYLHPEVDESDERFSWSKPNLQLLEKYAKLKFGWSTEKCNELLLPVMKKLLEVTEQPTIDRYFRVLPSATLLEGRLSKRVEGAVKRLGRPLEPEDSDPDDPRPGTSRTKKPRPAKMASDSSGILDPLTERLHRESVIPQRERDRLQREEQKKKAAEVIRSSRGRGRGRARLVLKATQPQAKVNLSESSSDST